MKPPGEEQEDGKQFPASDSNLSSMDPIKTNLSPVWPQSLRYGKFFPEHFSLSGRVSVERRRDEGKAKAATTGS